MKKTILSTIANIVLIGIPALFVACHEKSDTDVAVPPSFKRAVVTDGGTTITFPKDYPGLSILTSTTVKKKAVLVSVFAPSRVVASISRADGDKTVLFDSPDVTSLYSQYKQAISNAELTTKNLARTKDMFESHAATARDLSQAETEASNARATKTEFESKLRASGFNPEELGRVNAGSVWIISDVPENELNEVQNGEDVDVYFSSYPDKKFIGREEAIGEVVDPVTRSVKVRVSLKDPGGKFLPGMFARVDFGDPVDGVIPLPSSAVVTVEENDYVFVETGAEVFVRRLVTIVNTTDGNVIIRKGLEDGERVVTQGAMLLKGLSFGF
jgi:cobalt-zinc-cadmium efflux system membrane fusion protein